MVKSFNLQKAGLDLLDTVRTAGSYDSGGRDGGGITISRRPNKRPSREKAPGPSNAIAAAATITPMATSEESRAPQTGAGNQDRAIPRKQSPTRGPANGVRNPIAKANPLALITKPSSHLPKDGTKGVEKQKTPSAIAARPTAVRSRSKPRPGRPPGNVEYSLCSAYLPGALSKTHDIREYASILASRNPTLRHLFLTLLG